jgi:putative addiction module antidote
VVVELKLRKIGNSLGVILPKEALTKLQVQDGDTIVLTDAPDGGVRLTPARKEEFANQMRTAEDIIRRYRNTLAELAK